MKTLTLVACLLSTSAMARPNFIVITLDDAAVSQVNTAMPLTRAALGDHLMTFGRMFVEDALCAPSRATFFTGEYAHNHGVHVCEINTPDSGDRAMKPIEGNSLAVWLSLAGYRTGLAGKYMNGYQRSNVSGVPPGWSDWHGWNAGGLYNGFNYRLNENGVNVQYGTDQADFATDVIAQKAINFIRTSGNQPWFFYAAPASGHGPCASPVRHASLYLNSMWPGPKEDDVSDKPTNIQALAVNTQDSALYRKCLRSLASADEAVKHIWDTVVETGQANNTWLMLWSDNGTHYGEHKLPTGKNTAYEIDERVSLLVRGPNTPHVHEDRMVGNVDLAPTILELAGVPIPESVDGTSLVPLLSGRQSIPWRTGYPIRHWYTLAPQQRNYPSYQAIRTPHWKWVEWDNGQRELYNLDTDPNEFNNLASDPTLQNLRNSLSARAAKLATCKGAACRAAERQ